MNKTLFSLGDADITPREIAVSVIIILVMLSLGWLITNGIRQHNRDDYARLDTALKVTTPDIYNHAIQTKIGDIIAYGVMYAAKPITNARISGEYSYIHETEEHYVMKTRIVTYSCNCTENGCSTCTRTETYWEWDEVGWQHWNTPTVIFFGNEYNYNLFGGYPKHYIKTVKTSSKVRFIYNGVPKQFTTSIVVNTTNGTIEPFKKDNIFGNYISLYVNTTPEQVLEQSQFNGAFWIFIFWFVWIVISGFIVYSYVCLENKYLY